MPWWYSRGSWRRLHRPRDPHDVPFLQAGLDAHIGEAGQAWLHLFLSKALGALDEDKGAAVFFEHGGPRDQHGVVFGTEHDFGAAREIGDDAGVHLVDFDADGDFTDEAGAKGTGLGHGADADQRAGQFDIGIGIQVHAGFHAEAQPLGIHLVDGGVENHGGGIDNGEEWLAGVDLVTFADLAVFAVADNAGHDSDAIHGALDSHSADIVLGALQLDVGLAAAEFRDTNLGSLGLHQEGVFILQLFVLGFSLLDRELVFFLVDIGADGDGLEIEKGLVPSGLGGADGLIVSFLGGGQAGHDFLDGVIALDDGVFVVVEALQLVGGVEFGHHVIFPDVDAGFGEVQEDEVEIGAAGAAAAGRAGTQATAHAAAIRVGAAALNAGRQQGGEILCGDGTGDAHFAVEFSYHRSDGGHGNDGATTASGERRLALEIESDTRGGDQQSKGNPQGFPAPGRLPRRYHGWPRHLRWRRDWFPARVGRRNTTRMGLHCPNLPAQRAPL